jgi:hypothetical protein
LLNDGKINSSNVSLFDYRFICDSQNFFYLCQQLAFKREIQTS